MQTKRINSLTNDEFIRFLQDDGFIVRNIATGLRCISLFGKSLADNVKEEIRKRKKDIITILSNKNLPLSFAQQRLWFLDRYEDEPNANYSMPTAIRLRGALRLDALEKSFNFLIERHEILRTIFVEEKGEAKQIVKPAYKMKLGVEQIKEEEINTVLSEEVLKPFDLSQGPLMRVKMYCVGREEHVLLIVQHHIITDGWSTGVLLSELVALYNSYVEKLDPQLHELKLQYADFANWQRRWLQGEVLQSQIQYWQKKLDDFNFLNIPTDYQRPGVKTYKGKWHQFQFGEEKTKKCRKICNETGTTLFMLLLTVFKLLLARYSCQEDVVIGSPVANRTYKELEGMLGFFVNTLPLRTDLSGNPTFLEALKRVKQTCLEAYAHQDIPFEKLVEALNINRDVSRSPIFQVLFVLQNISNNETLRMKDLNVSGIKYDYDIAKYDLTLYANESENNVLCNIEYNTDLYSLETVEIMESHFLILLEEALNAPTKLIGKYNFLTQEEKDRLLIDWNNTKEAYREDKTIHELFEEQVGKIPNSIALSYGDERVTYKRLNVRANRLAHYLRDEYRKITQRELTRDTLIGLCIDRSIEMIVGMLAILKAGGAYLPIDPEYPEERLKFMLDDAGLGLVLVQRSILEKPSFAALTNSTTIFLDVDNIKIDGAATTNPKNINKPKDLAYVIYTSGSTGRPKGVLIQHQGVCNLAQYVGRRFGICVGTKVLQFASISFDASVYESMGSLLNGGDLHVLSKEELPPYKELSVVLEEKAIGVAMLPPAILQAMELRILPNLKTIVSGGDKCTLGLIEKWGNGRNFINAYGPTEITVCCTMSNCRYGQKTVTIGKPISNVQVYILDQFMRPVPKRVNGELYVGGVGLARGYLHRPEMTAERFVNNPYTTEEDKVTGNTKLYKTGDIARWLDDGNLEFIGRADNQVKVRGFRIELEEIELALCRFPGVKQCIVLVTEDVDKRLIAYYVANKLQAGEKVKALRTEDLRKYLGGQLPEYMLPSYFIEVGNIPLTPSGKLNKRALPKPNSENLSLKNMYVVPKTVEEKILAKIWAEVLKIDQVGLYDNFFSLGGDSIMSIQVISRARESGLYVKPKQLFSNPTIAGLAAEVKRLSAQHQAQIQQGTVQGEVLLTPIQRWFFEQDFTEKNHFNQAFLFKVTK
ncbi:MAG: amino acid adenylation domain-containing protein [Actinobacteria bacterium]|nr:amino acid adenylation domain-containing protein [Actinomycetota bacterium]